MHLGTRAALGSLYTYTGPKTPSSELLFLRLDVSNCPGAMNHQQLTTGVLGAKPGTDTISAGHLAFRASREA